MHCPFLLVSGTMRSGTSLLGELLYSRAYGRQCHPELAFANDSFEPLRKLVYAVRRNVLSGTGAGHPTGAIAVDADTIGRCMAELGMSPQPGETPGAEIRRRIAAIAPVSGSPAVVGTKSTDIFAEFDVVRTLFPGARMVITVRDPRDVLASNIRRVGEDRPLDCLTVVTSILNLEVFLRERSNDPDVLVVRYEDLVADPGTIVLKLLSHAGLDPERYDWSALAEGRIAANSSYEQPETDGYVLGTGVRTGSIGRYHDVLSALDVRAVERLLAGYMAAYGYAADAPRCADFESEFLNRWLPFLYSRSRVAGLSLAGLRGWMDANGLGPCAEDVERRMEWGTLLARGGGELHERFSEEPAYSAACHPLRRSFAQQVQAFRQRIEAGDWRAAEEHIAEAVAGEQGAERLFRMCDSVLSTYFSADRVLGYLDWYLSVHANRWRFVLPRRLAIFRSQGLRQEAERDLERLTQAYDVALAAHPADVSMRLSKVEQVCYFGGKEWVDRLTEDVRLLELAADRDAALAPRIHKAVAACEALARARAGRN